MADTDHLTMAGLNLIQQALSIYDSDLRLAVCNRRFKEMFDLPDHLCTPGASFEDTIRHLVARGEYGPVEDVEASVQDRVETARAFAPHYMERTRANGCTISVEGSPLPQGGWVTVYTDITHTREHEGMLRARSAELSEQLLARAEELSATNRQLEATITALEETKRQLTEMEARTRLTTEMMPAHIAHVGRDRRYTFSNRQLSAVMPGSPSQILGMRIEDALGDSYPRIAPYLAAAFEGEPSVFEFTDEPSSRRIRAAFTPDLREGTIEGVYILSMDITRESQARAALQQTRKRELAAQLTSGLAHDFSNLLTIILGSQAQLQRLDTLPDAAQGLVAATLSAARRGGTLLNRIADISGHRELHPRATDLRAFLADLATLAAPTLPRDIRLEIDSRLPDGEVMLDPGPLQDSLLNLILNARDACGPRGTIRLIVQIVRDTWLEFRVSDTGPGFSAQALEHALDPFFTTKGGEGTGLGLSMVYDSTKLAGGSVRLSNTTTGGEVRLRLPLVTAPDHAAPGLALLVEDSPDLRATIRDMLRGLGHSVIEAGSVDEALTLIDNLPEIGTVLSDISLEGGATGIDLMDRLPPDSPRTRVLMTSLPAGHPLHLAASRRAPVLAKPFAAPDLAALIGGRADV